MSIELRNISKTFGAFAALKNVSLTIPDGQLVALLGPSGSGKTTLLRIIAGLEAPDRPAESQILFHNQNVENKSVGRREVGFVFQHYALFRHMTVFENIAFGLRVRPRKLRPSKEEIRGRTTALLKLVQLENLQHRYPSQLSGGQRQRVALARALAIQPKVLLLDEPFGALDAKVRQELRRWLRRLHDEIHVTSVFVTHDQEEALEVADQIVVMNNGQIEQIGRPQEVYDSPANPFVYHFLGSVNLFRGRVHGGRVRVGEAELPEPAQAHAEQASIVAYVRPHDIEVTRSPSGASSIPAVVRRINAAGPLVRVELQRQDTGEAITADLSRQQFRQSELKVDEQAFITPRRARIFSDDYAI